MIEWNYFYGAILIDRDEAGARRFFLEQMNGEKYRYFHPSMFALVTNDPPFRYYYENVLIPFGTTDKYLLDNSEELRGFICEFEEILSNLDFETAKIEINATYAEFDLFWINRKKLDAHRDAGIMEWVREQEVRLYTSEYFYMGVGKINLFMGSSEEKYSASKIKWFDAKYSDFKY